MSYDHDLRRFLWSKVKGKCHNQGIIMVKVIMIATTSLTMKVSNFHETNPETLKITKLTSILQMKTMIYFYADRRKKRVIMISPKDIMKQNMTPMKNMSII